MGLTAIISSAASSASSASSTASSTSSASSAASSASTSVASLISPVGMGVGSVVVAAALILLLGYFDVLNASGDTDDGMRITLVASIIPLATAFAGVVLFQALAVY